jgi:hypothetical protein
VCAAKLSPIHLMLMRTLLRHMMRVASFSQVNRMPSSNLAAVLGPNILRANLASCAPAGSVGVWGEGGMADGGFRPMAALADAGAVNTAVRVMIEEQDYLFWVRPPSGCVPLPR